MNITDLNIPENLRTGDRISCRMGDETIEAEVTVAPKLVRVQLKMVYADLVQQCTHAEDLKLLVESRMIFV